MCFRFHPGFHVEISGFDQVLQYRRGRLESGAQLHVTHQLAAAFQQTRRVGQVGAAKEADIHMGLEDVDVAKTGIADARGRMTRLYRSFQNNPLEGGRRNSFWARYSRVRIMIIHEIQ